MKVIALALALAAPAAAFMHAAPVRASVKVFGDGKYDGQVWDITAKTDVWNMWDPNSPRSETNFNPFERNADGNACDCSGYFPGEGKYKDPMRPDASFALMLEEKEIMAKIEANPKPGDVPGAPGRLS
eukprot:CAMPEP_0198643978 /NCGR_PEP_ID=MMETSP1467-20131203/319_1 /TAXON_ID=1462469 /ORGANISM="unid. sp., Strain CCMP2135" /LENGTH=127 /DNA_ID=CAMNT_0044379419 /DNA_START=49 /DNA_END=432 /DNA_ORIENTATION=+